MMLDLTTFQWANRMSNIRICNFSRPASTLTLLFVPQKRQLSAQSLAFNLKDKVFCELFPEVVDVRTVDSPYCSFSLLFPSLRPLTFHHFLSLSLGGRR